MPMIDNYIDNKIGEVLLSKNKEREGNHTKSGKLSASRLGDPLQWQVLYALGVPQKEIDQYVVRKFLRGNQVEDWLVEHLNPISTQEFVEYRNVVGYIDAMCDTSEWENKLGLIPVEVKSVTSMKFKRIAKEGVQKGHRLQAGFYALAKGMTHFAICYVNSDDLRVHTIIEETKNVKDEIDKIITDYENARSSGKIPKFESSEVWQSNIEYSKYPLWMPLTEEEATEKYLVEKQKQ